MQEDPNPGIFVYAFVHVYMYVYMHTLIGETVKISYSRTFKRMGRAELFARGRRSPEIFSHTTYISKMCLKIKQDIHDGR